jgi:transposase InsO family protein
MIGLLCFVLAVLASPFKSKLRLEAENAVLRHQLNVVRRRLPGRVRLTNHDRWFFIQLYRWFPSILQVLTIIRPETLVRWHRAGYRCYWRWKSRPLGGRPSPSTWSNGGGRPAMGIRDTPTAPASPWQNGFVERLIGSIRRECVDYIIVLSEMHLRRVLKSYADYYNCVRTHRSLNKDAPVTRQIQRIGSIKSHAIMGGLHHRYARV